MAFFAQPGSRRDSRESSEREGRSKSEKMKKSLCRSSSRSVGAPALHHQQHQQIRRLPPADTLSPASASAVGERRQTSPSLGTRRRGQLPHGHTGEERNLGNFPTARRFLCARIKLSLL
ncbi:hypothetical protein BRADI_1g62983v3 [Brachypodium distachyon]|uniref:Uncharacterized protein n=1 Tax=Brachypodium distachyon TaxID=15368 RepID=A0A2K2DT44_BRADI|nr:hypothetical protein BRADI_1g62983v3 [Brachypodium distachyon]